MTASARALLIVVVVSAGLASFVASRFLDAPAPVRTAAPAPPQPAAPLPATPPAPVTGPAPPRFDVVRVGARGAAVVAGRAAPGAEVLLVEDGHELGRARADGRGEWVILPSEPLRPGTRQFALLSRLGGEEVSGPDSVVVVVPEPPVVLVEATDGSRAEAAARAEAEVRAIAEVATRAERIRREAAAVLDGVRAAQASIAAAQAEAAPHAEAILPAVPRQPLVLLLPAAATPRLLQGPAAPAGGGLGLAQVDYDDAGAIRFAGTAAPGATVRVYVDDRHAGDAQADPQGRWALAPEGAVSVGRHRLRLDQVAAAGAVAARIEVPFQRDELPDGALTDGRVVVQPGHNLWRLARAAYGKGTRFTVIYEANREQIRNPNMIFPGQVFALPTSSNPAESSRSR